MAKVHVAVPFGCYAKSESEGACYFWNSMVLHVVWKHSQIKVIVAFRIQCPEDDHTSTVNMLTIMSKVRIEAFMWVSQLISIQIINHD